MYKVICGSLFRVLGVALGEACRVQLSLSMIRNRLRWGNGKECRASNLGLLSQPQYEQ